MCGRPRTATVKEKTSREVFGMQIKQKLSFTSFTCPEAVWSGSICTFYEVAWLGWAETPTDATHADASSKAALGRQEESGQKWREHKRG